MSKCTHAATLHETSARIKTTTGRLIQSLPESRSDRMPRALHFYCPRHHHQHIAAGLTVSNAPDLLDPTRANWLSSLVKIGDLHFVAAGNHLLRVSIEIFNICVMYDVPVSLENPATSLLWATPGIKYLLRRVAVHLVTTEFCMWGTPWRKSSSFL